MRTSNNLSLDCIDAVDLGWDYQEIRQLQWSLRQEFDLEIEEQLMDLVIKNKEKIWKVCSLHNSNNWFKGSF
jgi:acyl carrier protein